MLALRIQALAVPSFLHQLLCGRFKSLVLELILVFLKRVGVADNFN
jgi:hypothetical protein